MVRILSLQALEGRGNLSALLWKDCHTKRDCFSMIALTNCHVCTPEYPDLVPETSKFERKNGLFFKR